MIYKATNLIREEMDKEGLKYAVEEFETASAVFAGFAIENGPSVRVQFVSLDNDNDVSIRLLGIVNGVPENKVPEMLVAVNECNCKYRYVKFTLDKDKDINLEYDIPLKTDDGCLGAQACEIFYRIMKIVDACYPAFMRVMWG